VPDGQQVPQVRPRWTQTRSPTWTLRSLYGLVQSGRNWYLLLSNWLTKYDFIVAFSEPCLYMLYKGDSYMILVTYVDDGLTPNPRRRVSARARKKLLRLHSSWCSGSIRAWRRGSRQVAPACGAWAVALAAAVRVGGGETPGRRM